MSRQLDRERVARYVAARRGVLDLAQRDLAELAGVDVKTINTLESGERWPQATTRSKVELALQWISGDLQRIAEGGEPTPTRTVTGIMTMGPVTTTATVRSWVPPQEISLVRAALQNLGESEAWAAARAGITERRWNEVTTGVVVAEVPELARMARAVGVRSGDIRRAGRPDLADTVQDFELDEKYGGRSAEELDAESFELLRKIRAAIEENREGMDVADQEIVDHQAEGLARVITSLRRRRRDAS